MGVGASAGIYLIIKYQSLRSAFSASKDAYSKCKQYSKEEDEQISSFKKYEGRKFIDINFALLSDTSRHLTNSTLLPNNAENNPRYCIFALITDVGCETCLVREMYAINNFYLISNKGIPVYGVCSNMDYKRINYFLRLNKIHFPLALDKEGIFSEFLQYDKNPIFFVIDTRTWRVIKMYWTSMEGVNEIDRAFYGFIENLASSNNLLDSAGRN